MEAPYPDTIAERIQVPKLEGQPWFDRIRKEAESQEVRVGKSEVIEGPLSIVGEIVHYAERNGVDLIVIGTRGQHRIQETCPWKCCFRNCSIRCVPRTCNKVTDTS